MLTNEGAARLEGGITSIGGGGERRRQRRGGGKEEERGEGSGKYT